MSDPLTVCKIFLEVSDLNSFLTFFSWKTIVSLCVCWFSQEHISHFLHMAASAAEEEQMTEICCCKGKPAESQTWLT